MTAYEIRGVSKTYAGRRRRVEALDNFNLTINEHERWGIVGESGSGKTTLLKILAGLIAPTTGTVSVLGETLDRGDRVAMAHLRRSVQMVFQDPRSSLDPRLRVADIISEPLRSPLAKPQTGPVAARVAEVLDAVGLPEAVGRAYPHELSGGQRQRVALARALAPRPRILLADEPVSALDVSHRAHVLNLLNDLVRSMGLTLVMVTHDLGVVRHTCDQVGVLRGGRLVESGRTVTVMTHPGDSYTAELLRARPHVRAA
ncbi:MAG: dipeptide/oligopeptide/nickel ABC transporter ATP-binding protein [Propionibacteriaceae bacterium]|jgi:peptide/nickel transport system ATP-binding protein|nr:dipeptide/oligopeptide/nickel ABC transporter ATP-binding protein [Propionibacteriaceae bacterium]